MPHRPRSSTSGALTRSTLSAVLLLLASGCGGLGDSGSVRGYVVLGGGPRGGGSTSGGPIQVHEGGITPGDDTAATADGEVVARATVEAGTRFRFRLPPGLYTLALADGTCLTTVEVPVDSQVEQDLVCAFK